MAPQDPPLDPPLMVDELLATATSWPADVVLLRWLTTGGFVVTCVDSVRKSAYEILMFGQENVFSYDSHRIHLVHRIPSKLGI